jgi:hypothetical protein
VEDIRERVANEKAREAAANLGAEILASLSGGGQDRDTVAQGHGLQWNRKEGLSRNGAGVDRTILGRVFQLERPAQGDNVYGHVVLPTGAYVVLDLESVDDPEGEQLAASPERETWMDRLEQGYGEGAYQALLSALRAEADVKIFRQRLQ